MKTQFLSLVGVTTALVLSTGVLSSAQARPTFLSTEAPTILAQSNRPNLNLTPEQDAQIKQIREAAKAQMDAILTPEQKAQLDAARSQGEKRQSRPSLNLTEQQKAQLKQIREATQQQIQSILTTEQKQQLEQWRQSRESRRQSRPAQ